MSNRYYTTFQEHCQELEKLMEQYKPKKDNQGVKPLRRER